MPSAPSPRLLDAVSAALAANLGASTQEIAAAAGISRATLHRAFASREKLVDTVAAHAVREAERIFDEAGIDEGPAAEAFERLSESVVPLAIAYSLLWSEPAISQTVRLHAEAERLDDRFERFFERGQDEGVFRADVAPRWLAYSAGAQAVAAWWSITDGHVGEREGPKLFRRTLLSGIAGPALPSR